MAEASCSKDSDSSIDEYGKAENIGLNKETCSTATTSSHSTIVVDNFTTKKKTKSSGSKKKLKKEKKKKLPSWTFSKFNSRFKRFQDTDLAESSVGCSLCVCTGYRRTEDHHLGAGVVFETTRSSQQSDCADADTSVKSNSTSSLCEGNETQPVIDLSKFNPDDYPIEDCDERARRERAREMEEGVDPPPGYRQIQVNNVEDSFSEHQICSLPEQFEGLNVSYVVEPATLSDTLVPFSMINQRATRLLGFPATSSVMLDYFARISHLMLQGSNNGGQPVHTQIDYIHCLVPDLLNITKCSFYWGKMDQYEAERLLENKPEGTFLLRDSAQEDYLFSVSFRRYGRSLHARIEQWNHKFSFDVHDPGVFASSSVCGLIEHYKDPSRCMFFEPMLTLPLHRSFAFSLQHLCRAVISDRVSYDNVNRLRLPKSLKSYLKEYHYRQRVRVRRFEGL
ncbi:SOCS5 (predicted) [Pycnogonum litorale]